MQAALLGCGGKGWGLRLSLSLQAWSRGVLGATGSCLPRSICIVPLPLLLPTQGRVALPAGGRHRHHGCSVRHALRRRSRRGAYIVSSFVNASTAGPGLDPPAALDAWLPHACQAWPRCQACWHASASNVCAFKLLALNFECRAAGRPSPCSRSSPSTADPTLPHTSS